MTKALVLIDGSIGGDLRILHVIEELGEGVRIIDIRTEGAGVTASPTKIFLALFALVMGSLWVALPRARRLWRIAVWQDIGSYLRGVSACMRWLKCSLQTAYRMRNDSSLSDVTLVHANDLYCAVAAIFGGFSPNVRLVYDSHELQIHRNRKTGGARILIEFGLEQIVLRRANELRVVNQAISNQMYEWYCLPSLVRVVYNDWFHHHPLRIPSAGSDPVLIYVGKGVQGRKLELIDRSPEQLGFQVTVFLLGAMLPAHMNGSFWKFGPEDYSEPLLQLVRERRCLMWCCLETTSLSYRLATPNKFFQALAMGIPVIASRGTYLAELVDEHEIGVVLDELAMQDLSAVVSTPAFEKWVDNVGVLRDKLRNGNVVI